MSKRSIIYVDGFNLYYGAVRDTAYKWLDLQTYFERLRQDDDIQLIRYFTAIVDGNSQTDQMTYLEALAMCPKVEVVLGKFKKKQFKCRVSACTFGGSRVYAGTEEKRTDVSIAIALLDDAYQDMADRFVVVSGDSDLVPAINLLKTRFPEKEVVVYIPSRNPLRGAAVEIRSAADKDRSLPVDLFKRCQFPAAIPNGSGGMIRKPPSW